jgi:hypothetical protein
MKRVILFSLPVLLAGCSGIKIVEQRAPMLVTDTTKSATAYADCVHERWAFGSEVFARPDGSYRVVHYDGPIVDVAPITTGAHIEMREPPAQISRAPENAAKACL